MTDEKWQELIGDIEEQFKILERKKEKISISDDFGIKGKGEIETIVFEREGNKIKLERTTKPMILDKKIHYAKTKGTGGQVEYILSETEKTHRVKAFKWNEEEGNWQEIDLSGFSL